MLNQRSITEHYPAGSVIVRQGEQARKFYQIEEGSVKLEAQFSDKKQAMRKTLSLYKPDSFESQQAKIASKHFKMLKSMYDSLLEDPSALELSEEQVRNYV